LKKSREKKTIFRAKKRKNVKNRLRDPLFSLKIVFFEENLSFLIIFNCNCKRKVKKDRVSIGHLKRCKEKIKIVNLG
jgi:hypothetical protein